ARNQAATAYDADLRQVLIPFSPSSHDLEVGEVRSQLFNPSGKAKLQRAAWSLPVTVAAPTALGDAAGAGYVLITLGPGLDSRWQGLIDGQVLLSRTDVLVNPSSFLVVSQAAAPAARQVFELWEGSASRRSSLEVTFVKPFRLFFASDPGLAFDAVQVSG